MKRKKEFEIIISLVLLICLISACSEIESGKVTGIEDEKVALAASQDTVIDNRSKNKTNIDSSSDISLHTYKSESKSDEVKNELKDQYILPENFDEIPIDTKIPKADEYIDSISTTINELGIEWKDVLEYRLGNYTYDDSYGNTSISMDIYLHMESKKDVIVSALYLAMDNREGKWSTVTIHEAETNNTVWCKESSKEYVDLYDYETGELISKQSKTYEDAMEEYQNRIDEIGKEGQKEIDRIKDEYGGGSTNPNKDDKAKIELALRDRIRDNYSSTDIDSITLNDDLGTEKEGDYIALVNLTWNVKNSGATSKKMLKMYSDDIAATAYSDCPDIQEIVIFWNVPYLDANAKCSYERKSKGMYEMDMYWDKAFEK